MDSLKYCRAVWRENGKAVEGTIPECWVNEKLVRWPLVKDAKKNIERKIVPTKDWKSFELIKIKCISG